MKQGLAAVGHVGSNQHNECVVRGLVHKASTGLNKPRLMGRGVGGASANVSAFDPTFSPRHPDEMTTGRLNQALFASELSLVQWFKFATPFVVASGKQ